MALPLSPAYAARIAALACELGIPPDYGATRGISVQEEAADLIQIGTSPEGREIRLLPSAAAAWEEMRSAAATDGVVLVPLSGFRSVTRQTEIIREKLAAGRPLADILQVIAAPGYSEHHTGRALDIGSPEDLTLEETFELTPAFRWLTAHAARFGNTLSYPRNNPHGIVYEPWHWCWRG